MWKKIVSLILVLVVAFGLFVSVNGLKAGDLDIPNAKDNVTLGLDLAGGAYAVLEAKTDAVDEDLAKIMEQTQAVIESRVNEMGLSEPTVTIEAGNRIRVELPGAQDAQSALEAIGQTAQLEFKDAWGKVIVTGADVKDAVYSTDGNSMKNEPGISITFNTKGSEAFYQATKVAMQHKGETVKSEYGEYDGSVIFIVLDDKVLSYPSVNQEIAGGNAFVSGSFTKESASQMAALIRGGSLPVTLEEVNTSIVGASLGADSFDKAILAVIIGILLIIVFMIVVYRLMGVAASIALLLYSVIYIWIFEFFGAVVTLPGIFGILLSIGMAVDANVIIFARIREEIASGKSIRVAVKAGFSRATTTILDSNITTLIAGIVLYQFGTGSVKGFAFTLMLGIIISMLTALLVTRLFVVVLAESKTFSKLSLFGAKVKTKEDIEAFETKEMPVVSKRKIWYCISLAIIVIGLVTGVARGFNYGIDFTGGTMMQIDLGTASADLSPIEDIMEGEGYDATVIYAGEDNDQCIIRTSASLDNDAREVVLEKIYDKYKITSDNLMSAEQFGGSVGAETKTSAVKSVIIACILMLIYIAIRFQIRFGVAAILALCVDVLTMIAFYGLFHIEVNSPFIAAILIILGYSINNTIVVFDRVRENQNYNKRTKLNELINLSVKQTLGRTINTSITTIIAVVALLILSTSSLRSYVVPVLLGLVAGTYSSIFVSGSILYDINRLMDKRATTKKENAKRARKAAKQAKKTQKTNKDKYVV